MVILQFSNKTISIYPIYSTINVLLSCSNSSCTVYISNIKNNLNRKFKGKEFKYPGQEFASGDTRLRGLSCVRMKVELQKQDKFKPGDLLCLIPHWGKLGSTHGLSNSIPVDGRKDSLQY